jgi:pimeloyl-ACP methyl ester carboxylesterase
MPSIDVNGTRLEYTQQGSGIPVIFVHGSLEDARTWRFQMAPFAQHYQAIAYSRRYHYPTRAPGADAAYTVALHAEDLAILIQSLVQPPAHLVCSSLGGYIALYLAARQPELVRTLVLGEPPLMPWLACAPGGAPLAEAFLHRVWEPAREAFEGGDAARGVGLFLNGVVGRDAFARLSPSTRAGLMDNAAALQLETRTRHYFSPFTCDDARGIEQPALLLDSELSPRLFHLILDEAERCLPHPTRVLITGTSHAMHLGNAEAYNETVLAFLDQH